MKLWVLSIFDRSDEYCEYETEVKGIYYDLNEAMNDFRFYCKQRTDEGDVIDIVEYNGKYYFSSESGIDIDYKASYVWLEQMDVIERASKKCKSVSEIEDELLEICCGRDET